MGFLRAQDRRHKLATRMPAALKVTYSLAPSLVEADVRAALDELRASLASDAGLRGDIDAAGGDADRLFADSEDAITLSSEGAGFGAENRDRDRDRRTCGQAAVGQGP